MNCLYVFDISTIYQPHSALSTPLVEEFRADGWFPVRDASVVDTTHLGCPLPPDPDCFAT